MRRMLVVGSTRSDARRLGRRKPTGFAILWILIAIVLATIVVAAAAPYLSSLNDVDRVANTANILRETAKGVDSFVTTVKRNGGNHQAPGLLSQLTSPIANGDPTSCTSQTMNASDSTSWTTAAPYTPDLMPDDGLMTPLGRINDTVVTRANNTASYFIEIDSVDIKDARALDLYIDGRLGGTLDTVQYANPAPDSTTTLEYRVFLPFTAC